MARSRETKIELTAYDDLFQTDESREEAKLSKIRDIPISEIDEFPDHPFKVLMDEDMEQLVESIKRNGVMTPATVRLKEDGRYELISGHRRKKACELAGLETLKCEVKELTRDEAIIVMVESNLQKEYVIRMCLNTLIYYFVCMFPSLKTFVISVEEHDHRIWIAFYGEGDGLKADFEAQHNARNQNLDYAMEIVQQYMQQHNICPMVILNEDIWKLGMGFEFIDRRENT